MVSTPERKARIEAILKGAIDPHVHTGPSIAPRAIDHLDLVREMSEAGFIAVVTIDHDYAGVATAAFITKHHPELRTKIFSGIVFNNVVGAINPYAVALQPWGQDRVDADARCGKPFSLGENGKMDASSFHAEDAPGICVPVLDANRKVRMVLASGHLHVSETWLVFEEAQWRGIKRLIFTHPEDIVNASMNDVQGIAAMGAMVEHSLCMFLSGSKFQTCSADDLRRHIDAARVDQTIPCSDLGQVGVFSPLEGFRRGVELCIKLGFQDADIHKMVSTNTARVLGIEALVAAI
jgi:hypothetical protein